MIVFKKLRYQNFLSTGNIFTEIDLAKTKTTLIVGENGAGKSTMLDALSYVLYNKAFRNVNKPQLINSIIGKNLLVEVEFTVGQKEYFVRRGMKPNVFEIYENGKLINQSSATRDYQQILEQNILKLNHKSFSQIVVLGSANFTPFMRLSAQARREVIEDLLDIQVFSVMNSILKERVATNKSELIEADHALKLTESKIEMNKKHLESIKTSNAELIEKQRAKIEEYQKEIEEFQNELETYAEKLEENSRVSGHAEQVTSKLAELADIRKKLETKLKKADKEIKFYEESDSCPTCKQVIDAEFKKEILSRNLKAATDVKDGLSKLEKSYAKFSKKLEELEAKLQELNVVQKRVNELNIKIRMNKNFISSIETEITELEKKFEEQQSSDDMSAALEEELQSCKERRETLISQQEVYNMAAQLLKDGGIKTKIIRQYIPVMNKLINKYLAAMDFFIEFTLDENFEEKIMSRHRDEFSYESFSEGEKLRIDLSLLFAWRAIAKLRNSASTNLLIMDEIFDSSLDATGTEEFMKILATLAQDTNVFIISHKTDQLFDKFDEVIRFDKVKNFSKMVA